MTTATELAALTERLSNFMDTTEKAMDEDRRERLLASAERRAILDTVNVLKRDMEAVKPVTDMVTSLRSKMAGAMMLLGFIGTIAWGGVVFFREKVVALLGLHP